MKRTNNSTILKIKRVHLKTPFLREFFKNQPNHQKCKRKRKNTKYTTKTNIQRYDLLDIVQFDINLSTQSSKSTRRYSATNFYWLFKEL